MQNYQETIISQYANSPTLTGLIAYVNQWFDPQNNINAFYNLVWNVATAQGYGLDVWGRIVGVSRVLNVASGSFFGMVGPAGPSNPSGDPFDVSPFYEGGATTSNYALSDSAFRQLIYAKALSNISDGSIASINQILLTLFPGLGNAYVIDNGNMTFVYNFTFSLTPVQQAIVAQTGVLPRPCGVSFTISHP